MSVVEDPTTFSVALVGVGGYGSNYVSAVLNAPGGSPLRCVAAIDPVPQASRLFAHIRARNVPLYESIEAFFDAGGRADLVVVSSPIAYHARHPAWHWNTAATYCAKSRCVRRSRTSTP